MGRNRSGLGFTEKEREKKESGRNDVRDADREEMRSEGRQTKREEIIFRPGMKESVQFSQ